MMIARTNSRLGIRLRIRLFGTLDFPPNDILPNIILLSQIKKRPNLRSPLRAQPLWQNRIRQPRDLGFALLDDDQTQYGDIWADDTPSDGFAFTFACAAGAVA